MANRYRVSGVRPVLGNDPGSEFEHEFASEEERTHIRTGRLEILPRAYRNIGPRTVAGAPPDGVFEAAFEMGQESALIEAGHIERVTDGGVLTDLKREDLDALARTAGVADPEKLPNKQAVTDAITAANQQDEPEGSE